MQRKTNLLYVNGPDSKFLTFSNYTECLTGNFLSTDTKIYPSTFLCIRINGLNENNKQSLIKILMRYYENKLAVLRDDTINSNSNIETNILPLNYLIETLYSFIIDETGNMIMIDNMTIDSIIEHFGLDETKGEVIGFKEIFNTVSTSTLSLKIECIYKFIKKYDERLFDKWTKISYIGNVTEYDYDGTYTDTILTINIENAKYGSLEFENEKYDSTVLNNKHSFNLYKEDYSGLYGWENSTLTEPYVSLSPIYDIDIVSDDTHSSFYTYSTRLSKLNCNVLVDNNIEFNVIIPLFDLVNTKLIEINEFKNNNDLQFNSEISLLNSESNKILYNHHVPLGIWLNDKYVNIERDTTTGFSQSWSLAISSQFKPFPYSNKYENIYDKFEKETKGNQINSYATFAQILSRQNKILRTYESLSSQIQAFNQRLNSIDTILKNIGTLENIEDLKQNLLDTKIEMESKYSELETKLESFILKWESHN